MPTSLKTKLKKAGVTMTGEDESGVPFLHCDTCGQGWKPMIQPGGRLYRFYYRCPKGCNRSKTLRG